MDKAKSKTWSLQNRISSLLLKDSTGDIEFQVGTPPETFHCHKIILAAGSEVFEAMFYGSYEQQSPIAVPDVSSKGFALMLQYLYSDAVTLQNESDAFEAAYSGKKYMIKSLFSVCEDYLIDKLVLSLDNVFEVHEEASILEMQSIQDCCLAYMSRNAKQIFISKSFLNASKSSFQDILKLDFMDIDSEKEIIEALWQWGKQQCKEKGLRYSPQNIRECTKEFLKYVRFFALSMEELVGVLEKCKILDTVEELELLWNFAMPKTKTPSKISSNICTESRTRSISNSSKIEFPGQYRYDGNLTSFLIENKQLTFEITVTGSPVTLVGVVIAFKAIPCYLSNDRLLEVEILASNPTSQLLSVAKTQLKAKEPGNKEEYTESLLFDDYIIIKEECSVTITVIANGEGIRLMQCTEETSCYDLEKSKVSLKFKQSSEEKKHVLPVKELLVI